MEDRELCVTDNDENRSGFSYQKLLDSIERAREYTSRLPELLPGFGRILKLLESGVFISQYNWIREHTELGRHRESYETLLGMMGHELLHHNAGFYYLRPQEKNTLSHRERYAAACIFTLIEYLSDAGFAIENMVLSQEPIKQSDLERMYETFSERLAKIGMTSLESFISDGMKKLVESGVLLEKETSGRQFLMATPVYFYLDIARKVAKKQDDADHAAEEALLQNVTFYLDASIETADDLVLDVQPQESGDSLLQEGDEGLSETVSLEDKE